MVSLPGRIPNGIVCDDYHCAGNHPYSAIRRWYFPLSGDDSSRDCGECSSLSTEHSCQSISINGTAGIWGDGCVGRDAACRTPDSASTHAASCGLRTGFWFVRDDYARTEQQPHL